MVAIKVFGMPSCCFNCDMQIDGYSAGYYCAITEQELNDNYTLEHRHPKCPLVEIEERKVGKWIYDKTSQNWRCSECNETQKTLGYVGTADFMAEHFRFCNHCGTEMRDVEDD